MKRFLFLFLIITAICHATEYPLSHVLEGKIPLEDKRYKTFLRALELIEERNLEILVETGTARCGKDNCIWDGCSTVIFGEFLQNHNGILYSVDINKNSLLNARRSLGPCNQPVRFIHKNSIDFLTYFHLPIDFLYLDSYDFEINNPNPSQKHHLLEIIAAYPSLTENSVILIDDCDLPYGGKGKLVIEYLLGRGWKIIEEGYQALLIKDQL